MPILFKDVENLADESLEIPMRRWQNVENLAKLTWLRSILSFSLRLNCHFNAMEQKVNIYIADLKKIVYY